MREQNTKIFGGFDAKAGVIEDFSSQLCINCEPRGAELAPRKGTTKENETALSGAILGIFNFTRRYGKRGSITCFSDSIFVEDEAERVPHLDGLSVRATYSDGSYVYFATATATAFTLYSFDGSAWVDYTLAGNYLATAVIITEVAGDITAILESGDAIKAIKLSGGALALVDSESISATSDIYGVYESSVTSEIYVYGNGVNLIYDGSAFSAGPSLTGGDTIIQGYLTNSGTTYLFQGNGNVQAHAGVSWAAHDTGVFVGPFSTVVDVSGTEYAMIGFTPGDDIYGIYGYDGTTLTRESSRRTLWGAASGTTIYAIDNSVYALSGASPSALSLYSRVTSGTLSATMQCAILGTTLYIVGGKETPKTGAWMVKI